MNTFKVAAIAVLIFGAAMAMSTPSNFTFPKPILAELPMYPEEARTAHVAGTVKMWFVLNGNGEVVQAGVTSGPALLQDAAMRGVKSWKFGLENIQPNVRCETEFVYVLNVKANEGEPKLTVSMTDYRQVEVVSELYVETISSSRR